LTRSDPKEDPRQDRPKSRIRLGSRLWGVAKGQFGGLFWRAVLYAVPLLGLGAYTTALNNFASKYVTLQNGNWIIGRGIDIVSLGNDPSLPGRAATGVEDFILRYAYQLPLIQIGSIVAFVAFVELLLFRRRRRNSIHL